MTGEVFLVGGILLALCTAVQSIVSVILIRLLVKYDRKGFFRKSLIHSAVIVESAAGILVLSFLLQATFWAAAYVWLGEFSDFGTSLYFSVVSYATLGYGDIVLTDRWRLLGALESLNGLIMGGFSASLFFTIASKILSGRRKNGTEREG
ncbi:MAG: ion channel [Chitinispirillaceae bacterium]